MKSLIGGFIALCASHGTNAALQTVSAPPLRSHSFHSERTPRPYLLGQEKDLLGDGKGRFGTGIQVSPDGRLAAFIGGRNMMWDLKRRQKLYDLPRAYSRVVFSPNGRLASIYEYDSQTMTLVAARTGKKVSHVRLPTTHSDLSVDFSFTRDSRTLCIATSTGVWRAKVKTGQLRRQIVWGTLAPEASYIRVFLASDHKRVMVVYEKGWKIYDAHSGKLLRWQQATPFEIEAVSPDLSLFWGTKGERGQCVRVRDGVVLWGANALGLFAGFAPDAKTIAFKPVDRWQLRDAHTGAIRDTLTIPITNEECPNGEIALDPKFALLWDANGKIWKWALS